MQFEMANCSHFVPELPSIQIRYSIVSHRYRLVLFCCHEWHRKQKSVTVHCKAWRYYESPSRQLKDEGKIFFRPSRRDIHPTCLYTLPLAVAVPLQNTSHRCWTYSLLVGVACLWLVATAHLVDKFWSLGMTSLWKVVGSKPDQPKCLLPWAL